MNTLGILILAIVQGLTEFLPVSSSGHTVVLKELFGFKQEAGPALEMLLHAGTLVSVLVYYRKKVWELLTGLFHKNPQSWLYAVWVVISAVPAIIVYAGFHHQIDKAFDSPRLVAVMLLVTGVVLISTKFTWKDSGLAVKPLGWKRALAVGCAQAVAILPGISRSGSTISTAKWLKVKTEDAFEFSFIMSIPVLAGGILLELKDFGELADSFDGGFGTLALAFAASAIVGYFALALIVKCGFRGKFWMFGIYCLLAGLAVLIVA